jgi:serine/threonine-protein kinase
VQPGDLIDEKYELIRLLGEGAMGSVFEGRHVSIGRRVALKFLHRDHKKEPESLARFTREAQAAASIGAEHIVEVTDIGKTTDGTPYLVMEYLEGEDLDRVLEREVRLEPARAANIAVQTCRAVGAAHARGIIHRDLKPANLYVARRADGTEHVKVLDFGIAKFRDSVSLITPNLTATGMVLGTPYYMPPEQARGAKKADAKSDIYSLGVLMYEMLTGEMPFKGETYNELIVKISTCDPTPVRMIRPELSEGLETVVM